MGVILSNQGCLVMVATYGCLAVQGGSMVNMVTCQSGSMVTVLTSTLMSSSHGFKSGIPFYCAKSQFCCLFQILRGIDQWQLYLQWSIDAPLVTRFDAASGSSDEKVRIDSLKTRQGVLLFQSKTNGIFHVTWG